MHKYYIYIIAYYTLLLSSIYHPDCVFDSLCYIVGVEVADVAILVVSVVDGVRSLLVH